MFVEIIIHRHAPDFLAFSIADLSQRSAKRSSLANMPAVLSQRNHYRARQRRQINHELRLETFLRVPQRIGQNETAFSIRIQHFNRLTRHGGHNIAGALCIAIGHIFNQTDNPDCIDLCFARSQRSIRPVTAAAPPISPFMSSIPPAGLMEIPPVSKHTPLPINATGCLTGRPIPLHDNHLTGVHTALPDTEQRPHAQFFHLRFAQHFYFHTQFTQRFSALGKFRRCQNIGQLIDQIARNNRAIGNHFQFGIGLFGSRCRFRGDGKFLWPAAGFVFVL